MTARATSTTHPAAALEAVDRRIEALPQGASSLAPGRKRATPLTQLVAHSSGHDSSCLTEALVAIAEAELRAFPGNLFWDFDYFVSYVDRTAEASSDYARTLGQITELVVTLLELYGQGSPIRFQYVHDFMYGFDWARWVRRQPEQRAHISPFGVEFLRSSEARAREIITWITTHHERYPPLEDGVWRNPFPFPREPSVEGALYRDLASRGMVPVETWRQDAKPEWNRDYDQLRRERAEALGLVQGSAGQHEGAP